MLKKLLILLFLLCLVPLAATLAEQMPESYFSDFSADEDGWYAQENASGRTARGPVDAGQRKRQEKFCFPAKRDLCLLYREKL